MGGQLQIHLDSEDSVQMKDGGGGRCRTWDVEPLLDRLVLFRSDLVDHEVSTNALEVRPKLCCLRCVEAFAIHASGLPLHQWMLSLIPLSFATFHGQVLPVFSPRLAVTLWFYGRQLGIPALSDPASLSARLGSVPLLSPPSLKPEKLAPGDDTRANVRPLPLDSDRVGHAQEVRDRLSWKFMMFNPRGNICSLARVWTGLLDSHTVAAILVPAYNLHPTLNSSLFFLCGVPLPNR